MMATIEFLKESPLISRLVFVQTIFPIQTMFLFAQFLVLPSTKIKEIVFSGVYLFENEASLLFTAVTQNRSVQRLVFHNECLDISKTVGQSVSRALSRNFVLGSLKLSTNEISGLGIRQLASSFKHLTNLELRDCEIDCYKVGLLVNELDSTSASSPASLTKLDLSQNDIRSAGLGIIAKYLGRENTKGAGLRSLSLAGNQRLFENAIREAESLAQAISVNHILRRLVLERCGLNEKTSSLLFQSIQLNTTLEEFNVRINGGIGTRGYQCMIRRLPYYRGLRTLSFDALYPQFDESLLTSLRKNGTLTKILPHYGFDKIVQDQVDLIMNRNNFYRIIQMVMSTIISLDPVDRWVAAVCLSRLVREVCPRTGMKVGPTGIFSVLRQSIFWSVPNYQSTS